MTLLRLHMDLPKLSNLWIYCSCVRVIVKMVADRLFQDRLPVSVLQVVQELLRDLHIL